jgi:predicted RNase H-like HicB family nuclease
MYRTFRVALPWEKRAEALRLIREAIAFHIDGLNQDGLPVPAPSAEGETVEVAAG